MSASGFISIWAKPPQMGTPPTDWWAENEHDENDIECLVIFWTGNHPNKKEWDKSFVLASGAQMMIGPKYDSSGEDIRVRLKRADFV